MKDYSACPCLHVGSPVRGHGQDTWRPRGPEEECFQSAAPFLALGSLAWPWGPVLGKQVPVPISLSGGWQGK